MLKKNEKIAAILLSLACIVTASCGDEYKCNFRTAGICFIDNGIKIYKEDIHLLINTTEKLLIEEYERDFNLQKKFKKEEVIVEFVKDHMYADCEYVNPRVQTCERAVDGVNYQGHVIVVEWKECIANSAFVHEILHSVERFYLGLSWNEMSKHNPPLFDDKMEDKWQALEHRANLEALDNLISCMEPDDELPE